LQIDRALAFLFISYGNTRKDTLLESVPLGVTTWRSPVVAPAGTVAVISELDATVKFPALPLKLTLVAPVRLVPRILTVVPTFPAVGCVSTNGGKPMERLKTVPQVKPEQALAPPSAVVPYKFPLVSWTSPAAGYWPSAQAVCEKKVDGVVGVPFRVILKTVPPLFAPPISITPYKFPSVAWISAERSEEHTSELQSLRHLVCRL